MTSQEILQQAINGVLQEKTLSKEAIDAVQQILSENISLKVENESLLKHKEEVNKANLKLSEDNNKLSSQATSVNDREKAVSEREKKADLLDLTVKYEQIRIADAKEFINTLFRNTIVRKNISSSIPISNNGYQNGTMNGSENHSTSEE